MTRFKIKSKRKPRIIKGTVFVDMLSKDWCLPPLPAQLNLGRADYAYQHVGDLVYKLNWNDSNFDGRKAYCMALLSELAYYSIAKLESNVSGRVKVVPCYGYQELLATHRRVDLAEAIRTTEADVTVLPGKYSVLTIFQWVGLIAVAVRGTAQLYDWLYNLNATRRRIGPYSFHRGFYKAMSEQLDNLKLHISKSCKTQAPLYFTGHSLGAAISGVLSNVWSFGRSGEDSSQLPANQPRLTSTYAFAMPRFGNQKTMDSVEELYHVLRLGDVVPNVPPKILGFGTRRHEISTNFSLITRKGPGAWQVHMHWLLSLLRLRPITDHAMELYRAELGAAIGINHPLELLPLDRTRWPGA